MDWLLALLTIFNLVSMITVFSPRAVPKRAVPWATFGTALLATELAWIWLPFQALLAWLFSLGGALDSPLGNMALAVLIITWGGLVWAIWKSTKAQETVEGALLDGLGFDYRAVLPDQRRSLLRSKVSFDDWKNPVGFKLPDVEVIKHIPYGPAGSRQQLDIYRPRVIPEGGCPVLFQIHGGAWMMGDKGGQALPLMYNWRAGAGSAWRPTTDSVPASASPLISPTARRRCAGYAYRLRLYRVPFGWRTRISRWEPPLRFVDEQLRGPYRSWIHTHTFRAAGEGTRMTDRVEYRLPGHPLTTPVLPLIRRQLDRIFRYRARVIRDLLVPENR